MSPVVMADFIALVARNACFVSTLKYESPGVSSCIGETGIRERDTAQSILSVLRLSLIRPSLCQLLSFSARLLSASS